MELGFTGKNILISGSSGGLGFAIAEGFMAEGANVILTGRNNDSLNSANSKLSAKHPNLSCYVFCGDLTDQDTISNLYEFVKNNCGSLDHLVCNLGSGKSKPVLSETREEWRRILDINLLSSASMVNTFQPLLTQQFEKSSELSTITMISSICGVDNLGAPATYTASKAALIAYAKSISSPLAVKGIRVNTVSPGNIFFPGSTWDEKLKQGADAVNRYIEKEVPLKRFARPEEIAAVVVFLASQRAGFVVGSNWIVDGGQTRCF